jgi:hypothetical protein
VPALRQAYMMPLIHHVSQNIGAPSLGENSLKYKIIEMPSLRINKLTPSFSNNTFVKEDN